jgi:hypothetical protein
MMIFVFPRTLPQHDFLAAVLCDIAVASSVVKKGYLKDFLFIKTCWQNTVALELFLDGRASWMTAARSRPCHFAILPLFHTPFLRDPRPDTTLHDHISSQLLTTAPQFVLVWSE